MKSFAPALLGSLTLMATFARADTDTRPGIAPDIREDEAPAVLHSGDFVAVPIPISNPTLDTGLVAGAAYFYPQTEEQKQVQPASVTGLAGLYTTNDSRAVIVAQQNYWNRDRWRFTGAAGAADIRLTLIGPDPGSGRPKVDWRVKGQFFYTRLSTRIAGSWYGGFTARYVDADQSFEPELVGSTFRLAVNTRSAGLGAVVEFDSRDMPINSYHGSYFKLDALFNDEGLGSNRTYQSYALSWRSYRELTDSLVLAWDLEGCQRGGKVPLWDACFVPLRGFSATKYLGKASAAGQVEARWRLGKRWGLVGFGGYGYVSESMSGVREYAPIPSYGVGVRFTVLAAKRVNLRVDYARSLGDDAVHVSVGEAF